MFKAASTREVIEKRQEHGIRTAIDSDCNNKGDNNILFDSINHESKYTFNCEFMDNNEEFLSVLVYEINGNKYEIWINMSEAPETMFYMEGKRPKDENFEDILLKYLEENYPDYFPPTILPHSFNNLPV